MNINFEILFTIDVPHDYYSGGYSPDFEFEPTEECRKLMANHQLIYKTNSLRLTVLSPVDDNGVMKYPLTPGTKLSFYLKSINPLFRNFSNLPMNAAVPGTLYVFNNIYGHIYSDSLGTSYLSLASNSSGQVTDGDQYPSALNFYSYKYLNATATSVAGTLQNVDTDEVLATQTVDRDSDHTCNFSFDTRTFSSGLTRLVITDGSTEVLADPFYLLKEVGKTSWGVIDIYHLPSLVSGFKFLNSNNVVTTRNYSVPFVSRKVRWRYIVSSKFVSFPSNGLSLDNGPSVLGFPASFTIVDDVATCESNNEMKLSDAVTTGIILKETNAGTIRENIPGAGIRNLTVINSSVFSEIFLTI